MLRGRGADRLPQQFGGSVKHDIIKDESGKHVSGQAIGCSFPGCTATERITTNNFHHRLPDTVVKKKFQQRGWLFRKNEWLCPDHAHPRKPKVEVVRSPVLVKEPPMIPAHVVIAAVAKSIPVPVVAPSKENLPMPEPTPLRSLADLANASIEKMGPSDRRRIFREIDDNWDDQKGRYLGSVGDAQIATKLNVARAWVESIRKEAFGDFGGNEDLDGLDEAIAALNRKVVDALQDAEKIVTRFSSLHGELRVLSDRVARVQAALTGRR